MAWVRELCWGGEILQNLEEQRKKGGPPASMIPHGGVRAGAPGRKSWAPVTERQGRGSGLLGSWELTSSAAGRLGAASLSLAVSAPAEKQCEVKWKGW